MESTGKLKDLPVEIIRHVFQFLSFSDRLVASHVCRLWYEAANDKRFRCSKTVYVMKKPLDENSPALCLFIDMYNISNKYCFENMDVTDKIQPFWFRFGRDIQSLSFELCEILENVFMDILKECPNLESLSVISCRDLFMAGQVFGSAHPIRMEKLKQLTLIGNQYLSDASFARLVAFMPALEELYLSGSHLNCHKALYKRFYPPRSTKESPPPSDNVLTFNKVLDFIKARATLLKKISFSKTLIDTACLEELCKVTDLTLESLHLQSCDQLSRNAMQALSFQENLKELNLSKCTRINDESLICVCENLPNLQHLNIQGCNLLTDMSITKLHKLKKLQYLNISENEDITSTGVEHGICRESNLILTELLMSYLNLDQRLIVVVTTMIPNLTLLDLGHCYIAVTDHAVQAICKNLVLLRILRLSHCENVTDFGFTGMGKPDSDSVASLYNAISDLSKSDTNIGPSSAVKAKLKETKKVGEILPKKIATIKPGYSLARLKGLRELDVSGCNRISDITLKDSFKFRELKILNVSKLEHISDEGIESVVSNCPAIEDLLLEDCPRMNDCAIRLVMNGLPRLRSLRLKGCCQLTDDAINAIFENQTSTNSLRLLDIQSCRNISYDAATSLVSLQMLTTLLISKPGPYMLDALNPPQFPTLSFFRRRLF